MTPQQLARFESIMHVEPNTGCHLWVGSPDSSGYGQMRVGSRRNGMRRKILVHRLAYEHFVGPIPEGLQLDHLCRQHCCVRPDHLEPVTAQENTRRGLLGENLRAGAVLKTHCSWYPGKKCRNCNRTRRRHAMMDGGCAER